MKETPDKYQTLRVTVYETFKTLEHKRTPLIYCKAFLFPPLYLLCYFIVIMAGNNRAILWTSYRLVGNLGDFNFHDLIHEAVHYTLFRSRKLNQWFVYFFDILRANSYIWRMRYVRLHHNYPIVI